MPPNRDDRYLQDRLKELKECEEMSDNCDKGPLIQGVIDKIDHHVKDSEEFRSEFREGQKTLNNAITDLARSQEKLIALHQQTNQNHEDISKNQTNIQHLYDLNRETDKRITDHLIADHSYKKPEKPGDTPDPALVTKAKRYDKMTWALIVAAGTWFLNLGIEFVEQIMAFINNGGG